MIKAVKFGGSSLADAGQFKKVKNIIISDEDRRYIVPSAPGKRFPEDIKVTDLLYKCYGEAKVGGSFDDTLKKIKYRYNEIIDGLEIELNLDDEFETIANTLLSDCDADYAASRGEYLNGIVLAAYLGYEFLDAARVIKFDKEGNFLAEETNEILAKTLSTIERAVIPGFYGSRPDGSIKTFSRGGSDITGSILARALHADVYENWTDVSGFMAADPRIVKDAESIDIITYKELRELSYMGASVLHESAIFPVRKEGIPVNIKNTNAPEDEGTMIVESTCHVPAHTITGIAGKKGFAAVNIDKDMMNSEIGFGRKVLEVFENNGLSFEHMPSGIDTMTIFVDMKEFITKEQAVIAQLHQAVNPDVIDLEANLALIAIVGRGMKNSTGLACRVFKALADEKINIKMIDQGSSELNIIVGVKNKDFENAIEALYSAFFRDKN
ncbi:MAG: aspartate kinase [Clostridiales bacterium]|nr:aspartate kinase [Clostridiales bacterium]MBS5878042.1 aspartate kinase [Clostridiales bacterium]MDU0939274.1 aspartate kinase [Clostridiales bacterium]MDU1042294.1 aspartate kinase [Clostridiales bacterium]